MPMSMAGRILTTGSVNNSNRRKSRPRKKLSSSRNSRQKPSSKQKSKRSKRMSKRKRQT